QVIGGETVVRRTARQETQIALDVDGIGGSADVELRLGIRSQSRAHRVTDGTIDRHALDPDLRPREPYGRVHCRVASPPPAPAQRRLTLWPPPPHAPHRPP